MNAINHVSKEYGYTCFHQNKISEDKKSKKAKKKKALVSVSYRCGGCKNNGEIGCATLKISRQPVGSYKIKNLKPRICMPSLSQTAWLFIPQEIKIFLQTLWDSGVSAGDAFNSACSFATKKEIKITWGKTNVSNLFGALKKASEKVNRLSAVLGELESEKHYVSFDTKEDGRISRFFIRFKAMEKVYRSFGSFLSLDATYGKNSAQFPIQVWVVLTNEKKIIPVAVSGTMYEEKDDYLWLAAQFYDAYKQLPRTIVIDGDMKMYSALFEFAAQKDVECSILTCIWHLWNNVEKHYKQKQGEPDSLI